MTSRNKKDIDELEDAGFTRPENSSFFPLRFFIPRITYPASHLPLYVYRYVRASDARCWPGSGLLGGRLRADLGDRGIGEGWGLAWVWGGYSLWGNVKE